MLLDNFLPVELVDKIYKLRHSLELKDVHDEFYRTQIFVEDKLYILKKNHKKSAATDDNFNWQLKQQKPLYSYYFLEKGSLKYVIQNVYR